MKKNYTLISMINGHELPIKRVSTFAKAAARMNRLMDTYSLELDEIVDTDKSTYFKCTQYRTWFRICSAC